MHSTSVLFLIPGDRRQEQLALLPTAGTLPAAHLHRRVAGQPIRAESAPVLCPHGHRQLAIRPVAQLGTAGPCHRCGLPVTLEVSLLAGEVRR